MTTIQTCRYTGPIPHEAYFVRYMPIDSLRNRDHKYADPRRQEFVRLIATDIAKFGLMNPVYVRNHDGAQKLVAGKHRMLALQELGWTQVPAMVSGPIADWDAPIEGVRLYTVEEAQSYLGDGLAFVDIATQEFWVGLCRPPENGDFHDLHKGKPYEKR